MFPRIPVSELSPRDKHDRDKSFHELFERIHVNFTRQLAGKYQLPYAFLAEVAADETDEEQVILPIGLLSSFVLANHYLKDFDERILHRFKPAYYGRYVDDILMVIANPQVPAKLDGQVGELNFDLPRYKEWLAGATFDPEERELKAAHIDELTDLELFVLENFNHIICLIDTPGFLNPGQDTTNAERIFKLNGYPRLYCQSEKTLLHYFDADESELVIDLSNELTVLVDGKPWVYVEGDMLISHDNDLRDETRLSEDDKKALRKNLVELYNKVRRDEPIVLHM